MPLYKGKDLIAGEEGSGILGTPETRLVYLGNTIDTETLRELQESWKLRKVKNTIVYSYGSEGYPYLGFIDKNSESSDGTQYVVTLTPMKLTSVLDDSGSCHNLVLPHKTLTLTLVNNEVTRGRLQVIENEDIGIHYLDTNYDYKTAYTPKYNNSPVTKQYLQQVINQVMPSELADVAFSGSYTDLKDTPQLSGVATSGNYNDLINTPQLSEVATSGNYEDLSNRPEIPEISNSLEDTSVNKALSAAQGKTLNDKIISSSTVLEYAMTGKTVEAGGTLELGFNYKVGDNSLKFYLNGEKLVPGNADAFCHYMEVGEEGTVSTSIKITSDWSIVPTDELEFYVRGEN